MQQLLCQITTIYVRVEAEKYFEFTPVVLIVQKMEEISGDLFSPISFLWRSVLLPSANFPVKM